MRLRRYQSHSRHFLHGDRNRQSAVNFHAADFGDLAVFFQGKHFFQHFVELLVVGHRENFLRGDFAVMQFNAAVGQTSDDRIVSHHDDRASLLVKFAQQAQNDFFVDRVEIASGFVGQNNFRVVDQRAGNANTLLLASGKLRRQVAGAVFAGPRDRELPALLFRRSCCESIARA